jgi:hypothetical protein
VIRDKQALADHITLEEFSKWFNSGGKGLFHAITTDGEIQALFFWLTYNEDYIIDLFNKRRQLKTTLIAGNE